MQRFLSLILSVGIFCLVGCGGPPAAPKTVVTGTVTYKGQPVNGAALQLYPTEGAGEPTNVPVAQDGTYRAADLAVGEYIVVVVPSEGRGQSMKGVDKAKMAEYQAQADAMKSTPTIKIPDKYKKRLDNPLKMTVSKGEQKIPLELTD